MRWRIDARDSVLFAEEEERDDEEDATGALVFCGVTEEERDEEEDDGDGNCAIVVRVVPMFFSAFLIAALAISAEERREAFTCVPSRAERNVGRAKCLSCVRGRVRAAAGGTADAMIAMAPRAERYLLRSFFMGVWGYEDEMSTMMWSG